MDPSGYIPAPMARELLLEIGVEELPASFVGAAIAALPGLLGARLDELRLAHGAVTATGTPRRLAVRAASVAERQPDLDEEVLGPPARVAFDAGGRPTKAAEAFAAKVGCDVASLYRKETPKGEYLAAHRREAGAGAVSLLPAALEAVCAGVPFRKSMRWSDGDATFGRPVRWLLALYGEEALPVHFAGCTGGRTTAGHRFLGRPAADIASPEAYVETLRREHVLVDITERTRVMVERLHVAAREAGGELIGDEFLVGENASLVEEPHVVVGSFDERFLELPERVILDVARGHQRYFGMRAPGGKLMNRYLAVANTAERTENVRRGNDRVMRARLADAKFFWDEDLKTPLGDRRGALDGIVFHKRLGTIGDKVRRLERLVGELGALLGLPGGTTRTALEGAALAKCDLVTLMVGELPELQGEMGRAYALARGVGDAVADAIRDHYLPRGAEDPPAHTEAGALVAIADRLDSLVGCCAINLMPSGTSDPMALRRAAIGLLRTLLAHRWDLSLAEAIDRAHGGFEGIALDLDAPGTRAKLSGFLHQRLRGVLSAELPQDAVDACLAVGHDRPHDACERARALSTIDAGARARAGEVFKRAANIAREAPPGEPVSPGAVCPEVHPSEQAVFDGVTELASRFSELLPAKNYLAAVRAVSDFAPVLGQFFDDVFVMVEDASLRDNRLRLMRKVHATCSAIANFNLLNQRS
jgi:glycyl-tRNA synthetase beta chain